MSGSDTDINYELAKGKAIKEAIDTIDEDWIDDVMADTYTEYEEMKEPA